MMGCDANDSQSIHLDVWSWGWGGEEGAGEEGGDTDARVKLLHCVAVCYHGNTMQKENIAHCQPATPPPSQFASVVWFLLSSPSRHACQYHLDPRKETRSLTLRDERTAFKGRLCGRLQWLNSNYLQANNGTLIRLPSRVWTLLGGEWVWGPCGFSRLP